jgi:hypothetical protein
MSDQFANWTEERPCQCSERNYFTTSLAWEEVPMLSVEHEVTFTQNLDLQVNVKSKIAIPKISITFKPINLFTF